MIWCFVKIMPRAIQLHDETENISFGLECSFSKKLKNDVEAIKYFICHYSLQKALYV